jgi:hypothetical protein
MRRKLLGLAALGLSAAMSAVNLTMPPMGGASRPRFEDRAPEYDGLGRKKRIVPPHPYSRKQRTTAWRQYRASVLATHSHNEDRSARRQVSAFLAAPSPASRRLDHHG